MQVGKIEYAPGYRSFPPPVIASQQPTAADRFRETFAILHNLAMWDLEDAGVIRKGDDDKWKRYNNDLTTFVLKLDDGRLDALYGLVEGRISFKDWT